MQQWELKLKRPYRGKREVVWEGETGEQAAIRFLDCCDRNNAVVAVRSYPRYGVFSDRPDQIIG